MVALARVVRDEGMRASSSRGGLLPQSSIGTAVNYCITQWDDLMWFFTDPTWIPRTTPPSGS